MSRRAVGLVAGGALMLAAAGSQAAEKVIFDTDFNTMGDDGQAFVMMTQAMAEKKVDVLGVTVVSGNQWLDQEVADALSAVERMGVADEVKVYSGALNPLTHDYATLALEQQLFGKGYAGAWRKPRPTADQLVPPPDGFAQSAKTDPTHAVEFIVDTVKANPNEVTILAIGPLTNLALAFRMNPEIVPLVKRIVYMGGAIDVPGNVTPAAEFNWWFDPEAADIVLHQPIEHVIIPLDVTNTAMFDKQVFDKISGAGTPVASMFKAGYEEDFAKDPNARAEVWDTLAAAYILDPTLATDVRELNVDVDTVFGANYGRSLGHYKSAGRDAAGQGRVRDGSRPVLGALHRPADATRSRLSEDGSGGADVVVDVAVRVRVARPARQRRHAQHPNRLRARQCDHLDLLQVGKDAADGFKSQAQIVGHVEP